MIEAAIYFNSVEVLCDQRESVKLCAGAVGIDLAAPVGIRPTGGTDVNVSESAHAETMSDKLQFVDYLALVRPLLLERAARTTFKRHLKAQAKRTKRAALALRAGRPLSAKRRLIIFKRPLPCQAERSLLSAELGEAETQPRRVKDWKP